MLFKNKIDRSYIVQENHHLCSPNFSSRLQIRLHFRTPCNISEAKKRESLEKKTEIPSRVWSCLATCRIFNGACLFAQLVSPQSPPPAPGGSHPFASSPPSQVNNRCHDMPTGGENHKSLQFLQGQIHLPSLQSQAVNLCMLGEDQGKAYGNMASKRSFTC